MGRAGMEPLMWPRRPNLPHMAVKKADHLVLFGSLRSRTIET